MEKALGYYLQAQKEFHMSPRLREHNALQVHFKVYVKTSH